VAGKHPCTDDSIDYLNHPACSWIDQNSPIVDKVVKARAFIGAQQAANPARDTASHAADRPAYGAAFGCATFRTGGNALSLHRERRGEQSRNYGYSEFFLHRRIHLFFPDCPAKHRPSPKVPWPGGEAEIRVAGPLSRPIEQKMHRAREPCRAC
jgi:hypothetical protein